MFLAGIAKFLGSVQKICAKNSQAFASQIAEYIDSKDQQRGDKKSKKDKKKDKKEKKKKEKESGNKNLKEMLSGEKSDKPKKDDGSGAALWPLIRQVQVRCPSAALSTGVILVDLPGVADANAARNVIAKDYMKKCDCIWILAPITRAVDDKAAKGKFSYVILCFHAT